MKLFSVIAVGMIVGQSCSAQIRWTPTQCAKVFGRPISSSEIEPTLHTQDQRFELSNLKIGVQLVDGIVSHVDYQKLDQSSFSQSEIESLLQRNTPIGGYRWRKTQSADQSETILSEGYGLIDPKTGAISVGASLIFNANDSQCIEVQFDDAYLCALVSKRAQEYPNSTDK
jgi:hypothetical protein